MLGYSEITALLNYKIILLYYQDVQETIGMLCSSYIVINIAYQHFTVRE